jgi:L-fucose/D-arabinose isomerase
MGKARRLTGEQGPSKSVTFGVMATGDPRIDEASRQRAANIVGILADEVAERVRMPNGQPVDVVWTPLLVDGEKQADIVGRLFRQAGVDAVICAPDTWAFPQLTLMSLLAQLPGDVPVNITCGNSGPKPGVVYAHAVNGALAQSGRLAHLNVGTWPDTGAAPQPTDGTTAALVDWCYAALTYAGLKGRRVVVFGHDSMGMETALAHVIPTRQTFGLEITRLDMKLLADMLQKGAYDKQELARLRAWIDKHLGGRLDLGQPQAAEKFNQSLALYLIVRDLLAELNAVGGGFMNQLEWGSDLRGIPLPIADAMESLLNSTFDHNGPKPAMPFATEADVQGLLTMLFGCWLSGGSPPLFMDFRKVWEPWEIQALARSLGVSFSGDELWARQGIVDGDNSGSASFDWAGRPGDAVEKVMAAVSMPGAELYYFPGGGNSVAFITPGGIDCIASRLAYSSLSGMFSMVWDEATTVDLPPKLSAAVSHTSNHTWPHTWIVPKYAVMAEYKQYAPANHFHAVWGLRPARLEYWMDLANVLSVAPWSRRPQWLAEVDRPLPLLYVLNGGESAAKLLRAKGR